MGGMTGEVRGTTKIETYRKYKENSDRGPDGTWYPDPTHKKQCYREMERDPETREFVLYFHFHT
jgi:hypothetical protein